MSYKRSLEASSPDDLARKLSESNRWIVALAGMLVTSAFGFVNSFSVFFPSLTNEFGWSRAQVASVFSIYTIAYSVAVIPMGRLAEAIGPRRTVFLGAMLVATGFSLSGAAQSLWSLRLTYGVIAGVGASALWIAPMFIVSQWFQDSNHKGLALGIVTSGALGATFPIVANQLIGTIGWRYAYVVTGASVLSFVTIALFFLKPRQQLERADRDKGNIHSQEECRLPLRQRDFTVAETLRTRQFWLLYVAYGFGLVGLSMAQVHLIPLATDRHIDAGLAAIGLSLAVTCGMGSRIAVGALSDRIGRKRVFVMAYGIQALALLWLMLLNQAWMLLAFAAMLGFAWGGWITAYAPILGEYFGLTHFTTLFAIATSNFAFGAAFGPYVAGYVFDRTGSYIVPLAAGASLSLVAFAIVCLLTTPSRPKTGV